MDAMTMFLTSGGLLALVKAFVDFVKYIKAKDTNGWFTQLTVWVAGIGATLLAKASDLATSWNLGSTTLEDAKVGTVILAGLGLGSAAMLVNSFKKAFDQSDSDKKPDLVGPSTGEPPKDSGQVPNNLIWTVVGVLLVVVLLVWLVRN